MLDPGQMELKGARAETSYTSLFTAKFFSGLQTQRSPFAGIDTRYGTRFLGGRPDALIAGSNVEISNHLTITRRPGLSPYGVTSIPKPLAFYAYESASPSYISLVVDTAGAVYLYSPTYAGILFLKASGAGQTNFITLVNTMYMGDGLDLLKYVGPNLLAYSNTFTNAVWTQFNLTFSPNQTDPLGGSNATQVTLAASSSTGVLQQFTTAQITPRRNNTYTISVWMQAGYGAQSVSLNMLTQTTLHGPSVIVGTLAATVTTQWTRYQLTVTLPANALSVGLQIELIGGGEYINVYGAQMEVSGPATPTQITTNKIQGVYNWGIIGPGTAPTFVISPLYSQWAGTTSYSPYQVIVDSNGNIQEAFVGGTSGGSAPTWAKTVGSVTTDGSTLQWVNQGVANLSPKTGYQYYYAYLNSTTGQPSNVSPISAPTGPFLGSEVVLSGVAGNLDPQVDSIAIYRNTDGGGFWYQLATIPNPALDGMTFTWTYTDTKPDSALNTSIYAPIAGLNTPPPGGLKGMEMYAGRMWGFVGTILYYATGPDNAALLNIIQNGVSAESWAPINFIPFDAPIVRLVSTTSGLIIFTTKDIWVVTGSSLSTFAPYRLFASHGLRSYNAVDVDGSTIIAFLADKTFNEIAPNTGVMELGFPIGDVLQGLNPSSVYVARHVGGSTDNGIFLADGSTGWYRNNPNQIGASLNGEVSPVWSPKGNIVGGVGAIASIETAPGVKQLLVGQTGAGVVLYRNLSVYSDNGGLYPWSAAIGSIVLATPGMLALCESISVESMTAGTVSVGVLLDEISGAFESLPNGVNDPPQLTPSASLNSLRYYLSQGTEPPLCRHLQIQLSGASAATADEVLSLSIRGALVAEQT